MELRMYEVGVVWHMNLRSGGGRTATPLPRSGSETNPNEPRGFAASGWRSGSLQASQQPASRTYPNAQRSGCHGQPAPAGRKRNRTGGGVRAAWKPVRNLFGGPHLRRAPPTHPLSLHQLPAQHAYYTPTRAHVLFAYNYFCFTNAH